MPRQNLRWGPARAVGLTAIAGRANDYLISVLSMFAGSVSWILMCCLAYKVTDSKEPQGVARPLGMKSC